MDFRPFDNINIPSIFGKVKHFLHPGSTFSPQTSSQNITKCYNFPALLPWKGYPPAPFRARVLGGIANFRNVKRKSEPSQFPKQEFHPAPPQVNPLSNKVHFLPGLPLTAPTPRPYNGRKWPLARSKNQAQEIQPLSERKSQCLNLKQRAGNFPPWNSKS